VAAAIREDLPVVLHTVSGESVAGEGLPEPPGVQSAAKGTARAQFDTLAEAEPRPGTPDSPVGLTEGARIARQHGVDGRLLDATNRLRQHRPGDTLVYLTGVAGLADLGLIGALGGAFPTIVTGVLGPIDPAEPRTGGAGMLMLRAEDGVDFAAEWDGVGRW
jgi:hypothetical protein